MPRDGVPRRRSGDEGMGRNSQDQFPFSPRAQRPSWVVRVEALSWVPWASGQGVAGGALAATGMERPQPRAGKP